jgi:hypothetical protein
VIVTLTRFDLTIPALSGFGLRTRMKYFRALSKRYNLVNAYLVYDTFSSSKSYTGAALYQVLQSQYFQMHVAVSRFPVFSIYR